MEDLKDIFISPLPDSPYVKPFRFNYTQNGKQKSWDLLEVHDSVAIVVFNITRKVMVFVKQFRPAIYYNCISPEDRKSTTIDTSKYPASLGIALEMCAGIIDKDKSVEHIAQEEVLEECGYSVPLSGLQRITSYRSGVGVQGALQTFFYCEVTDAMKTEQGGGVDDELIEVVEKTIPEIEEMVNSPGPIPSPPSCLFALMWFLYNKADKFRKFLATGKNFEELHFEYLMGSRTVSAVVKETCTAIWEVFQPLEMKPPSLKERWLEIAFKIIIEEPISLIA